MLQVALPIWLMIVLGLGLVVLMGGAIYGLAAFMRQLVGGEVDFAGTIPDDALDRFDAARHHPRLRGVDEDLARELRRQAEDELGPR